MTSSYSSGEVLRHGRLKKLDKSMFQSKFYDSAESLEEDFLGTSPDEIKYRKRRPSETLFQKIKRSFSMDKGDDRKEDYLTIPRLMLNSLSISQQIINSQSVGVPEKETMAEEIETFQSQTPRLIRRKCMKGRTTKEKFDLPYELKRRKSISSLYDEEDGGKKKQEDDQNRLFVPEQVFLYERLSFKGFEDFQPELNHKSDKLNNRDSYRASLSRKLSVKPQPGTVKSLVKIFESKSDNRTRTKRSLSSVCEDFEKGNEKVEKEEICPQNDAPHNNEVYQNGEAFESKLNPCDPISNPNEDAINTNSLDVLNKSHPDIPEGRNSLNKDNNSNYDIIRHTKRKSARNSRNENEDSGYFNGEVNEDISSNKDEPFDESGVELRKHSNDSGFSSYEKNRRLKSRSDDSNRLSELSNDSAPISTDSDSLSCSVGSYDFEETELSLLDVNQSASEEESDNKILTSPLLYLKPLYQIYSRDADAAARIQITHLILNDTEDVEKSDGLDFAKNRSRIYWKDTQRVQESGYLDLLPDIEKKKQEAKFEIYMSEASYVKSLNVLEKHYMKNLKYLTTINMYSEKERIRLTEKDFKALFGNIMEVRKSSENFLKDLDKLWKNDVLLTGIYDIMREHATDSFRTYIRYSTQYLCMTKKLEELIRANGKLKQVLDLLSTHPSAQNLPLESFLALPIQRITRFPLLMKNVMQYIDKNSVEYRDAILVLRTMKKLAQECDNEIEKKKRTEEMLHISQIIEFSPEIRGIPIMKSSRYLVLQTKVQQFMFRDKAMRRLGLQLFLFDDILLVTKKSCDRPATEEHWTVIDYCKRDSVQAEAMDKLHLLGIPELFETNAISLSLQSNHKGDKFEMVVSFDKLSDKERWLAALTPSSSDLFRKTLAAEPDCVQVTAINNYKASRPDELSLWIGDVVNVIGEPLEGWCRGEKLRNGKVGWFPKHSTLVIEDDHVKKANMNLKRESESSDEKQDLNRKYSLVESYA